MAVTSFATASGASLPEGTTSKIISGRIASGSYTHATSFPAGTYLAKCKYVKNLGSSSNTLFLNFGSNNVSVTSKGADSLIKLNTTETSLTAKNLTGNLGAPVRSIVPTNDASQRNILYVTNPGNGMAYQNHWGYNKTTGTVIIGGGGDGNALCKTSDNGNSYTAITIPDGSAVTNQWMRKISYIPELSKWFMVLRRSSDSATEIYTSTDEFATSTKVATLTNLYNNYGPKTNIKRLSNGTLYFLTMFTESYTTGQNTGAYSTDDGVTWSPIKSSTFFYTGITFFNGYYYAADGNGGGEIYRSTDMNSWTKVGQNANNAVFSGIASGGGYIVAVGQGQGYYSYSSDGTNWTSGSGLYVPNSYFQDIIWNPTTSQFWVLAGNSGQYVSGLIFKFTNPASLANSQSSENIGWLAQSQQGYNMNIQGDAVLIMGRDNTGNNGYVGSMYAWTPETPKWKLVAGPGFARRYDSTQQSTTYQNGSRVALVGVNGTFLYSYDYGNTFYLFNGGSHPYGFTINLWSDVVMEGDVIMFATRANNQQSYYMIIYTSKDAGATWTSAYTQYYGYTATTLAYDANSGRALVFITDNNNGYNWMYSSDDLITWTSRSYSPGGSNAVYQKSVAWVPALNKWIGMNTRTDSYVWSIAPNGSTSAVYTSGVVVGGTSRNTFYNFSYVNGLMFVLHAAANLIYSLDLGKTWFATTGITSINNYHRVKYYAGMYYAYNQNYVYISADGITWTLAKDYQGSKLVGEIETTPTGTKVPVQDVGEQSPWFQVVKDVFVPETGNDIIFELYSTGYGDI